MQNVTALALLLSLAAAGVAGYLLLQERADPADLDARLVAIEDRMAGLEDALQARGVSGKRTPTLMGLEVPAADARGSTAAGAARPGGTGDGSPQPGPDGAPARPASSEELAALVDQAVEKKAAEMQVMRVKKPPIDLFAKTLQLSDTQREAAAREIVRAQHDIQAILEIPAEDGTHFLDELVEVVAQGIAAPGKNAERSMRFFGRLLSEKIPGSDETYAVRIERVKQGLRDGFKRDWSEKQYATFEAWRMDPTEVKEIEGSPWKALETRILERARRLGAKLPEREDR